MRVRGECEGLGLSPNASLARVGIRSRWVKVPLFAHALQPACAGQCMSIGTWLGLGLGLGSGLGLG